MTSDKIISRPFDELTRAVGKKVLITLKGDKSINGTLQAFDVHLNVILEDAEELTGSQSKAKHSKIMIRGDNILWVSL